MFLFDFAFNIFLGHNQLLTTYISVLKDLSWWISGIISDTRDQTCINYVKGKQPIYYSLPLMPHFPEVSIRVNKG